jgi:hypothetical protein
VYMYASSVVKKKRNDFLNKYINAYKVISRFEYFRIIFESLHVLGKQRAVLSTELNFDLDDRLRFSMKNHTGPQKNKNYFFMPKNRGKMHVSA